MGIRADIRTFLKADAGILAQVAARVYAVRRPTNDKEDGCIVFSCKSSGSGHDLSGKAGFDDRELEILCFSKDIDKAEDIADATRIAMKGYSGAVGSTTAFSVMLLDEEDDYVEPQDESDKGLYVIGQRYFFKRQESSTL